MKIGIINSGCRHLQDRFWGFMQHIGAHYYHMPEDFQGGDYHLLFVEASCKIDISNKVGRAKIIIVDLEDNGSHFNPGPSFFSLKDRALAYGKLVIEEGSPVSDLKEIMLPVAPYLWFNQICELERPQKQIFSPFFRGVGSFISRYSEKYPDSLLTLDSNQPGDVKFMTLDPEGNLIYSQRYQWFLQFEKAGISGDLGLVWGEGHQGLKGQTELFGNVGRFTKERISYEESIRRTLTHNSICLPTGFCRWSFRNYDATACGSVMLSTDYGKKRMLYEPKVYHKILDHENIADHFNLDLKAKDFTENREVLRGLTPEKIWNKFIAQLND